MKSLALHTALTLIQHSKSNVGNHEARFGTSSKVGNVIEHMNEGCIDVEWELGARKPFTPSEAEGKYANAMQDAAELAYDKRLVAAEGY